ncbi:936_t:CDS:2 [Diversispora eburnea]|uniref:936_t:CDS:1 n=1 Tax=Diversispora eburnea TaxID=1213867 RepID=A0A9N9BEU4_9GLOM|nr:936_t:CDS:2 [Diversispora eburnea]
MTSTESAMLLTRNEARKLRKLQIKKRRAYETVTKFENVTCNELFSDVQTQYLCLINVNFGGVGNVTTEQLIKIFNSFKGYIGIRLTHGKPYSFVMFDSASTANIPGLFLIENFISDELSESILNTVYSNTGWILLKHRKVVVGEPSHEFPSFMNSIFDKLKKINYPLLPEMEQLSILHYPIGTGIPPHIDTHSSFGEFITSISLGSPVIMEFKNVKTGEVINIDLPDKSLLILSNEARYVWSHSIRARKSDQLDNGQVRERGPRVSLTLRTLNPDKICKCSWPELCDRNIIHLELNQTPNSIISFIPRKKKTTN